MPIKKSENPKTDEEIEAYGNWLLHSMEYYPGEEWNVYCAIFFNTFAIGELAVEMSFDELASIICSDYIKGMKYRKKEIKESLDSLIKKGLINVENNTYSINVFHELNILYEDKDLLPKNKRIL